jgi:hypothetical protein
MRKKRGKPFSFLITAIGLTAAAFLVSLAVWFFTAGEFTLFGLFDRFFFAGEDPPYEGNVRVYAEYLPHYFEITPEMEKPINEHFRDFYDRFGDYGELEVCDVTLRYVSAAIQGSYAVIEVEESFYAVFGGHEIYGNSTRHLFDLKRSRNIWRVDAHEIIE